MNEKASIKHPSSGGTWRRNADGSLTQVTPSTAPHPGKHVLREQAQAAAAADAKPAGRKARATAADATDQENGNV